MFAVASHNDRIVVVGPRDDRPCGVADADDRPDVDVMVGGEAAGSLEDRLGTLPSRRIDVVFE